MTQRIRSVEQSHIVFRAGRQVNLVIAGSRSANDQQILDAPRKSGTLDPGAKYYQAVNAVDLIRRHFERIEARPIARIVRLRRLLLQETVLNVRPVLPQRQTEVAVSGDALLIEEIAGQSETKCSHEPFS